VKVLSRHIRRWALALLAALLATSCMSVDKFIEPDDELLSHNTYVTVMADSTEAPDEVKEALKGLRNYTIQKPNKRLLGTIRLKMRLYCLSNPDKEHFPHRYLRRQGEAPVVYDENAAYRTCQQIQDLLETKGCFHSEVHFDTTKSNDRDVDVFYRINPRVRYRVEGVTYHAETNEVDSLLQAWQYESLVRPGQYYDQEVLDAERSRIIERLRNEGYYLATTDLVSYLVDTAFDNHTLTVRLNLRNPVRSGAKSPSPLQKYRLDHIYIYPNTSVALGNNVDHFDTLTVSNSFRNRTTDYTFLYNQPMALKTDVLTRNLFLYHGQTYRTRNTERAYNSLLNLRNFRYINIEYAESPNSSDSSRLLDAKVRLLNAKRQRITTSIELNNSSPAGSGNGLTSGNLGIETKIGYQNKNLFRGGELFKAEWSFLLDLPKLIFAGSDDEEESDFHNKVNNFETAVDLSLDIPTFLFPFSDNILWPRMRPHTVVTLGGAYQYRYYFERVMFNTGFGYNWTQNLNGHQLLPFELTYVRFLNIDDNFRARMESISDARLKYQYSDHFIMDARYDYVYNSQKYNTRNDFNYVHLSIETAGNLLQGLSTLFDGPKDENGIRQFFDVPYSQYVRFNGEYKHYFYLGQRSTFVARIMAGVGIPYKNSYVMPYEKSFYGGGPTTLRAWQLRYLGPGTFQSSSDNVLERVGDMQLVANLEYRFPLFSIFEGALFADMGNVWLLNESEEFPGGQFNLKEFPESVALCSGLGLRANISILTLRADFAIPVYDPGLSADLRWRPAHWKVNQINVNFGIDYPF